MCVWSEDVQCVWSENNQYVWSAVLGKLIGKCSELSNKLLYIQFSFTTLKLLPREMQQAKLHKYGKSSLTTSKLFFFIYWNNFIPSQSYLSDQ